MQIKIIKIQKKPMVYKPNMKDSIKTVEQCNFVLDNAYIMLDEKLKLFNYYYYNLTMFNNNYTEFDKLDVRINYIKDYIECVLKRRDEIMNKI